MLRRHDNPMTEASFTTHPYRFFGSLRFLLALLVLVSHSIPSLRPIALGNIGIFMFFVLSGFVIFEALDIFYKDSVRKFLVNRCLKIYPAYWACLTLTVLVLYTLSPSELGKFDLLSILKNISLIGFYFSSPTTESVFVVSIAWAVIVELLFYVGTAIGFWIGRILGNVYFAFLLVGIPGILGYLFCYLTQSYTRFYGHFQFAPYFVVGSALYILMSEKRYRMITAAIGLVGITLMYHSYVVYNSRNPFVLIERSTAIFAITFLVFVLCTRLCYDDWRQAIDQRLGSVTYFLTLFIPPSYLSGNISSLTTGSD